MGAKVVGQELLAIVNTAIPSVRARATLVLCQELRAVGGEQWRNILLGSNSEMVISASLVSESILPRLESKILNIGKKLPNITDLRSVFAAHRGAGSVRVIVKT
jgi:hypothetical protein